MSMHAIDKTSHSGIGIDLDGYIYDTGRWILTFTDMPWYGTRVGGPMLNS